MAEKTLRQKLIELLSGQVMSISQLARTLEVKFSEIDLALQHVEKSIRPKKIKITPARCKECGFVFRERKKFTPPSRCPECKSEWISEATFRIA
jgi:hypothetical protein